MKPFILESAEFNHKEMEVVAQTDCGVFTFPVLPAYEGQEEQYITRFENGRYVIRTKDYDKLKAGDYGEEEKIKLVHEVCHYDRRVIIPAYSTGRRLAEENSKLKTFLHIDNLVEDLATKQVLRQLGFSHKMIDEVIRPAKTMNNIRKFLIECMTAIIEENSLPLRVKELAQYIRELLKEFSTKIKEEEAKSSAVDLFNTFDFSIVAINAYIDMPKRIEIKELEVFTSAVLKKLENEKQKNIYFVSLQLRLADPIFKIRWELERDRLLNLRPNKDNIISIAKNIYKMIKVD